MADLSKTELAEFARCEKVIRDGLPTFRDVGDALAKIRDSRWYRPQHATFEAYCQETWGWGQNYANRLVAAAKAENVPIGTKTTTASQPANEAQQRELNRLPKADRPAVWAKVVKDTGGKPTAAKIKHAVDCKLDRVGRVMDGMNAVVKVARLEPVFRERVAFASLQVELNKIRVQMREIAKGPAGRVMRPHLQKAEADLRNIREAVKFSTPYSECTKCHGTAKVCLLCGNPTTGQDPAGWITKDQFTVSKKR